MIDLILNNPYEEITVRGMAKHAGVGFKTFYRHYRDKADLMQDILEEFLVEVQGVIVPPTSLELIEKNTLPLLYLAQKHADLLRALLRTPLSDEWTARLIQLGFAYGQQLNLGSHDKSASENDNIRHMAIHQLVHGTITLIRWWLENDMPYTPEEMTEYIKHLIIRPVWGLPEVDG